MQLGKEDNRTQEKIRAVFTMLFFLISVGATMFVGLKSQLGLLLGLLSFSSFVVFIAAVSDLLRPKKAEPNKEVNYFPKGINKTKTNF